MWGLGDQKEHDRERETRCGAMYGLSRFSSDALMPALQPAVQLLKNKLYAINRSEKTLSSGAASVLVASNPSTYHNVARVGGPKTMLHEHVEYSLDVHGCDGVLTEVHHHHRYSGSTSRSAAFPRSWSFPLALWVWAPTSLHSMRSLRRKRYQPTPQPPQSDE